MKRVVLRCDEQCISFPYPDSPVRVGSRPECDLVVPFPGVSRVHAEIGPQDGKLVVRDLQSKNGVVQNGRRVQETLLAASERVFLGKASLVVEEIESGDSELALVIGEEIAPRPLRRRPGDSEATADLVQTASASAAMAFVRELEGRRESRLDPTSLEGRGLLELCRRALGAESLWVWCDLGGELPVLTFCAGVLPEEAVLAAFARTAGDSAGSASGCNGRIVALAGDRVGLVQPLSPSGAPVLAVMLLPGVKLVGDWQEDFFDYLGSRLMGALGVPRRAKRGPQPVEPLRLPPEFVRGHSPAMEVLLQNLQSAAASRLDVLVLGETGTGKEMIAKTIHASGPTSGGPFVAINCAAIPSELLEAELFGVEGRIATGVDPRPGLFVKAEGGTILLDEIGDMPPSLQAKLLRTLQEREILPLGGHKPRKIHVRIVSASNKNLAELVAHGTFRADLYYRLRGLQFHIPPLRDRREDLPALVLAFVSRAAHSYSRVIRGVSRRALALLTEYDWPGNIRELQHEIERAVLLCPDGGALESEHFATIRWAVQQRAAAAAEASTSAPAARVAPPAIAISESSAPPSGDSPAIDNRLLRSQVGETEKAAILEALTRCHGNKSRTAKLLGVTRNGLAMKMRRLGISGV